jgi:hypothetical protein
MKTIIVLFCTLLPILVQGQKKNCYWFENNLQINYKGVLKIESHDNAEFDASSKNFQFTIKKRDLDLSKDQMGDYLGYVIKNMGYLVSGEVNNLYKDFLATTWYQAQKDGYWGIFFLLKDELNGDNYFLGFITTANKPKPDVIDMVESFKVVEEGTLTEADKTDEELIPETNKKEIHNELLELMKKYSPDIYKLAHYYYKLPTALDGVKMNVLYDVASEFKNTIPYHTLYDESFFIFNLIYRLNEQASDITAIEASKTTTGKEFFSIQFDIEKRIDIEKIKTPPASIINESYPQNFKGSIYADCIFPSEINRTTQINGIFGLMGEFIASSYRVKWYNDFLQYYYDKNSNTPVFDIEYIYFFPPITYNALLYKHFIVKYLSVIKSEMPEIYARLYEKADFRFLIKTYFAMLDQSIKDFNTNKTKIRNELGDQYIPYLEDESSLVIDKLKYDNNDKLMLFNSLVNFIDTEPTYQQVLTDFEIAKGEKIIIIKE